MIRSVKIDGYRALRRFSMENLSRVNLLVGMNNTGKTSVLEALYLLSASGDPAALWQVLIRRGEQLTEQPPPGRPIQSETELCHLFWGHKLALGTKASISATNGTPPRSISFEVGEISGETNLPLLAQMGDVESGIGQRLALKVQGEPSPPIESIPMSPRGGLRQSTVNALNHFANSKPGRQELTANRFITTESLSIAEVQAAFNAISLSPREDRLIRALQFIEPNIERIAVSAGVIFVGPGWPARGGLKVKFKGVDEPVPIGSLGEGIWRLLSIAISITSSPKSVFLIDEIDTGLHFSVMDKFWKFVIDVATEFDVQVFATTHSLDCVRSLASLSASSPEFSSSISIQRLQADRAKAIFYTPDEIAAVAHASRADEEIEVR